MKPPIVISLEIQLDFDNIGLRWSWETAIGGGGMDASLTGIAELTWRRLSL
jgi:hypothetical protein